MRSVRGKVIILVALGLLWALLFVPRRPSQPPERTTVQAGTRSVRTPASQGGGLPRLKLELLNAPRAPYPGEEQSIFGAPPPPPPPPRPVEVARPGGAEVQPPPDPFEEEAKQLRYVGFLRDGNAATAFIVQGQQVHTVATGDMVAGRFRVVEVGEDAVVLSSPAGDKQARLPLAAEAGSAPRPQAPGIPPRVAPGMAPGGGPVAPPGVRQ
jgi:hypothetical protein